MEVVTEHGVLFSELHAFMTVFSVVRMPPRKRRKQLQKLVRQKYGTPEDKEATVEKRKATLAANKVRPSPLLLETLSFSVHADCSFAASQAAAAAEASCDTAFPPHATHIRC